MDVETSFEEAKKKLEEEIKKLSELGYLATCTEYAEKIGDIVLKTFSCELKKEGKVKYISISTLEFKEEKD